MTDIEPSLLAQADAIINGQRRTDYGSPLESFGRIARMWSAYLDQSVSAEDVANLMVLLKVCRARQGYHFDSYLDIAGYAGCVELVQRERNLTPHHNPQEKEKANE